MKIPVYEPMQVAPQAVRPPAMGVTRRQGVDLREFASGLGAAAEQVSDEYQRQKHAAEAKKVTDGVTQYQEAETEIDYGTTVQSTLPMQENGPEYTIKVEQGADGGPIFNKPTQTEQVPGFLSTKGEAALAAIDKRNEKLEERRLKIREGLTTDFQRQKFDEETTRLKMHSERRARGHVAQEIERASEESLKANTAIALKKVGLEPENEELATELVGNLAGRASAMLNGRAPEVVEATVDGIRAKVAETRAQVLMERATSATDPTATEANWKAAYDVVKGSERALGRPGQDMLAKIAEGREVGKHNEYASALMRTNKLENGQVDEASVWRAVAQQDGETQKKLSPIVTSYLAHHRKAYEEDTKRITNTAASHYLLLQRDAGPKAWNEFARSDLGNELRIRNWAVYNQLQNGAESDLAREERQSRIRLNNTQARKEQAEIDRIIQNRWETTIRRDPDAHLDTFMATEGRQGSKWMRSELEKDQAVTQQVRDKGLLTKQTEFVTRAMQNAEGYLPPIVGTQKEKDAARNVRNAFEAKAGRAYAKAALAEKNGGDLSEAEAAEIIGTLLNGLPPMTDEGADREAKRIVERGGGYGERVQVMPELDVSGGSGGGSPPDQPQAAAGGGKVPFNVRVKQLRDAGVSKDKARKIMLSEGY